MDSIQFFRSLLCTDIDATKRFNDFVKHVKSYGLEYEVFTLAMGSIEGHCTKMTRDEIESHLSDHAYDWDL